MRTAAVALLALATATPARAQAPYPTPTAAPTPARACKSDPCVQLGPSVPVATPPAGRVVEPHQVAGAVDGRIAVADGARRVIVYAADGTPLWSRAVDGNGLAVAFGSTGDVYVGAVGAIDHFAADGTSLATITDGLRVGDYDEPTRLAVGGDGLIHAVISGGLLTWSADGKLMRRTASASDFHTVSIAADGTGRVARGSTAGLDLLAADDTVAKHISDDAGIVAFGADGRLRARVGSELRTYDAAFLVSSSVSAAPTPPSTGGISYPDFGVSVAGDYLLTDDGVDRIARQAADGTALPAYGTDRGTGVTQPVDVAGVPDGDVLVADARSHRIVRYGPDGAFRGTLWDPGEDVDVSGVARFADGDVLATAQHPGEVVRLAPDGAVRWRRDDLGWVLQSPAAAPDGTAWVRSEYDTLLHLAADGTSLPSVALDTTSPYLSVPGLGVGPDGRVWVSERGNALRLRDGAGAVLYERSPAAFYGIDVFANDLAAVATGDRLDIISAEGDSHLAGDTYRGIPTDVATAGAGRLYYVSSLNRSVVTTTLTAVATPAPVITATASPTPSATPFVSSSAVPRVRIVKAARVTRGRARLVLACSGARCRGRLTLRAGSLAGRALYSIATGRRATITVRLSKAARHRLARRHRLRVRAAATVAGGTTARRRLTLR